MSPYNKHGDEIVEPKKPDMSYMSSKQQLIALHEYKLARNRWIKALKKADTQVIKCDESIEKLTIRKKKRTMKDSQWKAEQENRNPQQLISNFFKHKRRKKDVSE